MKFQNVYESNIDYQKTYERLWRFFSGVDITRKGLISFRIRKDVEILISPKGIVQVAWRNEEEKQTGLNLLKAWTVPRKGKKVVLKSLHQNVYGIPFPEPEDFKLLWCEEGTHYFSFDRYSQLKGDINAITEDYIHMDDDSAQRRADLLYKSDILPESWKRQLDPLFQAKALRKLWKPRWVQEFLIKMRRLIWKNSRSL